MADNKKIYRIPRDVLSKMTGNNPQAIKALENISTETERAPENNDSILIQITQVSEQAQQSAVLATQAAAIINQALSDIELPLNAVSVPQAQSDYLQAVSITNDCFNPLQPV